MSGRQQTTVKMLDPREKGWWAWVYRWAVEDCPYRPGSKCAGEWLAGWEGARDAGVAQVIQCSGEEWLAGVKAAVQARGGA